MTIAKMHMCTLCIRWLCNNVR